MHELGIVFHIIKEVDDIAEQNKVNDVKLVTLEIGEVSGVIPKYVEDCWKWAVINKSKYMKDCALNIITLKATSYCEDCRDMYPTVPDGKICPKCKGKRTYLVSGNEIEIRDIQVKDND